MSKTYEALRKAEAERGKATVREGAREAGEAEERATGAPRPPAGEPADDSASREAAEAAPLEGGKADVEQDNHRGLAWLGTNGDGLPQIDFEIAPWVEEEYQRIRSNMVVAKHRSRMQIVMVSGVRHGEGVTTTSALFASVLAKGKKCLLVDANLRTPALAEVFQLGTTRGLTDWAAKKLPLESALVRTHIPNLFVMTAGRSNRCPAFVFDGHDTEEMLQSFRRVFDFVIFDAPPLPAYSDTSYLAARVDGVILVVQAESTRPQEVLAAKRELERIGANVLGVVLNRTKRRIPARLEGLL